MTMIVDTARIAPFPAGFWPCSSLTKARLKVLQVHYSLNVAHCVEHHVQFADSSAVVKKLMALATLELTPSRSWQKALISIFACASTELQCFSYWPAKLSSDDTILSLRLQSPRHPMYLMLSNSPMTTNQSTWNVWRVQRWEQPSRETRITNNAPIQRSWLAEIVLSKVIWLELLIWP